MIKRIMMVLSFILLMTASVVMAALPTEIPRETLKEQPTEGDIIISRITCYVIRADKENLLLYCEYIGLITVPMPEGHRPMPMPDELKELLNKS